MPVPLEGSRNDPGWSLSRDNEIPNVGRLLGPLQKKHTSTPQKESDLPKTL